LKFKHRLIEANIASYLLPGRGDFPAFTTAKAGTRFSDSREIQG